MDKLAFVMSPAAREAAQNRNRIAELAEPIEDNRVDDLTSRPVPYNDVCGVEIPEVEDQAFKAVRYNDLTMIVRRIKEGFDINTRHQEVEGNKFYLVYDRTRMVRPLRLKEYTLLHVASVHSNIETISFLLSSGADVNIPDLNLISPLALAAAIQRPDVVRLLLAHGADPDSQGVSGGTPLIRAILANDLATIRLLVQAGADLELTDTKGSNALLTLANIPWESSHPFILKELIDGGCTVDYSNKQGATPLMVAASYGKKQFVEILVEAGADINRRDKSGLNVMHLVTGVNTAFFLINKGASSDVRDNKGKRPIERAAETGLGTLICLLLAADCHRSPGLLDTPRVIHLRSQLPNVDAWLENEMSQPRSLKRLCRQSIRTRLSPDRTAYINSLPLPRMLKDFLLVKYVTLPLPFNSLTTK